MKDNEKINKEIGCKIKKLREEKSEYQKETVYNLKKYGIDISDLPEREKEIIRNIIRTSEKKGE
jgi:hypothetical protein